MVVLIKIALLSKDSFSLLAEFSFDYSKSLLPQSTLNLFSSFQNLQYDFVHLKSQALNKTNNIFRFNKECLRVIIWMECLNWLI